MTSIQDQELQPLLQESRQRENSVASFLGRSRSSTINSLKSGYYTVRRHRHFKKFVYLLLASFLLYFGFTLAFLPRTSLSRDFRRFHFSRLTKAETYRIYLESLQRQNNAQKHSRAYTKHRHFSGDQRVLQYTVDELKSYGFLPRLEKYYPWLNTPVDTGVSLWIDDKMVFNATMFEEELQEDPSSSSPQAVRGFHGYSATGNVTAQYVFCNYGKIEDYEYLLDNGIEIEDKIHIIRYDSMFRGLKVKNAEAFGASAVILYTDAYDDGYVTEKNGYKPYPKGPARNPSGIQRGSVEYFTESPGDPTTPGYASKHPNTKRVSPKGRVPTIPSVPMSGKEVTNILQQLNGKGCKLGPGGNIEGFEYYSGPSDPTVQLQVYNEQDYSVQEIVDVVVEIPGILHNNEIIIANHRDSWTVGGAGDPNSGSSILLEIARGISELRAKGWKPLRTIKLISWDGEEPAMLGSTEYGEDHASDITKKTLAYFNLDTAISGSQFHCEANPLLKDVLIRAAKYTTFKGLSDLTLYDHWRDTTNLTLEVLGSGTDFAVFQNHLGVPSGNFKFVSNGTKDAVYQYHTNYDSYTWMEKFIDPYYQLHQTMAIFTGLSAIMLSENELINFGTHGYMSEIWGYYQKWHALIIDKFGEDAEVRALANTLWDTIKLLTFDRSIAFDANTAILRRETVRDYPWWQLYKKVAIFKKLRAVNSKLKKLDRLFVTEDGLQDRSWMKHSIYGPDKFTGYTGDVLPGLHEALIFENRVETSKWLNILLEQFGNVVSLLSL